MRRVGNAADLTTKQSTSRLQRSARETRLAARRQQYTPSSTRNYRHSGALLRLKIMAQTPKLPSDASSPAPVSDGSETTGKKRGTSRPKVRKLAGADELPEPLE